MFCLFLFLLAYLSADESLISTLENDPSVFIEGKVNALTGKVALSEEDLVIQGAQPIHIPRCYVAQKKGSWSVYETLATVEQRQEGYRWTLWEQGYPIIYKEAGKVKIGKEKFYRYVSSNLNEGFSNTFRGEISSRTNPKNNYFLADEQFKFIEVHSADGTIRNYKKSGHKTKGGETINKYRLLSEKLPNGNWILYEYEFIKKTKNKERYYLKSIRSTNPQKTKTYAQAQFCYVNPKEIPDFTIKGSDGQEVSYRYRKNKAKRYSLAQVSSSAKPDQFFETFDHDFFAGDNVKGEYQFRKQLASVALPLDRKIEFSYYLGDDLVMGQQIKMKDQIMPIQDENYQKVGTLYIPDWRKGLIKNIRSRVGTDPQLQVTHSFIYEKGKTSVYDCEGNRTDFSFDDTWHLQKIERFAKDQKLLNKEQLLWGKEQDACNLVEKVFFDSSANPIFSKRFFYDQRGNVIEARIYGNLSGAGSPPILDVQGFPRENSTETYTKYFRYSDQEPNLLLEEREDNGKRIVYQYLAGTDLLTSQAIYDKDLLKELITYEYNEDFILIREIHDDGIAHTIREFELVTSGPYLNMPEVIRDKYWDGIQEVPLATVKLTYTTGGRIAQKDFYDATGAFRYSLKTTYDEKGRPITKTNAQGFEEQLSYDLCGNLIQHRDLCDRMITKIDFDYSNRPYITKKLGFDGVSLEYRCKYDQKGNLLLETDQNGASTSYCYDSLGHRVVTKFPMQAAEKGVVCPTIQSIYDSAGNEICKIDATGNKTQIFYNIRGKPTLILHPDGAKEEYRYYLDGTLSIYVDPLGVTTSYVRDAFGRVLQKTIVSYDASILSVEYFQYKGSQLISKVDAEGNCSLYTYDGAGRKISEEFANRKTFYTYDSLGRNSLIQIGNRSTFFERDLFHRVIEERVEDSGKVLRWNRTQYDQAGNPVELIRSIEGKEIREFRTYDSLNRLISKSNPSGVETTIYQDSPTPLKIYEDQMGLKTIETFDAQRRCVKIEKIKNQTLSLEEKIYDLEGLLSVQTNTIFDEEGASRKVHTRWHYDSRKRLIHLIEADGDLQSKETQYEYTPRGEQARIIKPNGVELQYTYHPLGSLIAVCSSDGSVSHKMRYNRLGHLVQSDDISKILNPNGDVLQETFPQGFALENTYDFMGRRTQCQISHADCRVVYEYNACDLLRVFRKTLGGTTLYSHRYNSYDLSGNLLEQELIGSNGTLSYSFDSCGRKSKIIAPNFHQEVIEFDRVGNLIHMRIQGDDCVYTYDDLYQLTSEEGLFSHRYRYDSMQNCMQKDENSYRVNSLNQFSHLVYEQNGNAICLGELICSYDALDRLIRAEIPGSVWTYTYDFENRRLSETINGKTRYFLYDGKNEIGVFDEDLKIRELRILGATPHAEIGAAIALELEGKVYAPIHDLQGNNAQLIPLDGIGFEEYRYSAFGEEKRSGKINNPWGFSSKRKDGTGLVYFGRRFYSPQIGRWLTPDPAGFIDGMNLYAYVHNAPLTHFDEYGLVSTDFEFIRYLSGDYKFEKYYRHYVPDLWEENRNSQKPRGEILYVSGIGNNRISFEKNLAYLSRIGGNIPVHGIHMPTFGGSRDISTCLETLRTGKNSTVSHIDQYFKEAFKRVGSNGRILVIPHSAGGMHTYFSGIKLPQDQRAQLTIRAFAPAKLLWPENFPNVQNYASSHLDPVMKWHQWIHKTEYNEALQSGVLQILPAHPDTSKFYDHEIMSPTFKKQLKQELEEFSLGFDCR